MTSATDARLIREDRPPNNLDASTGAPVLSRMPGKSFLMVLLRNVLLSLISLIIVPIVLFVFAFIRFNDLRDVFCKVYLSRRLDLKSLQPSGEEEKVWGTTVGRCYAKAVEYQKREGFCSSTTMRCMLRSYNVALPTEKQVRAAMT